MGNLGSVFSFHAASYVTMAQKMPHFFIFDLELRGVRAKQARMLEAGINIFSPRKSCVGSKIKTRRLLGKGY